MRKNVKKVIAPLLAAAMALSCTVCVSAAEDETIKLTVQKTFSTSKNRMPQKVHTVYF